MREMKEYTMNKILQLYEIYVKLREFNNGYSKESFNYYKGKAEAVYEIIELLEKAEND